MYERVRQSKNEIAFLLFLECFYNVGAFGSISSRSPRPSANFISVALAMALQALTIDLVQGCLLWQDVTIHLGADLCKTAPTLQVFRLALIAMSFFRLVPVSCGRSELAVGRETSRSTFREGHERCDVLLCKIDDYRNNCTGFC